MKITRHFAVLLAVLVGSAGPIGLRPSWGQTNGRDQATLGNTVNQFISSTGFPTRVTPTNPLPVTGSFSSTGFTPALTFATLTATNASASVALPAGATVAFQNTGTTTVSCTLGVGSATATANEIQVPASSTVPVVVGSNTFGACIDQTGSASNLVVLAGGSGLGTGFGGGGGSGGGAVTLASGAVASGAYSAGAYAAGAVVAGAFLDGWNATQGAKADAAWVSGSGSVISLLKNIAGGIAGSIPAGTNVIGHVIADTGSTTAVTALPALPAGANSIGTVLLNTTPSLANGNGVVPTQGGAVLSATNGGFQNILQGNAALTAANPIFQTPSDGTHAQVFDPCKTAAKSSLPITLTTSVVKVIAIGVAAKKTYVCHLFLTSGAADNVAVFEATTATVCATSPVAMIGAGTSVATAANGLQFAANGGMSLGNGDSQIAASTVNNNDVCLGTSAATPLSGVITFVQQ